LQWDRKLHRNPLMARRHRRNQLGQWDRKLHHNPLTGRRLRRNQLGQWDRKLHHNPLTGRRLRRNQLGPREHIMKVLHLYQIKMLDGSQYRGEIAYRDDEKIVLKLRHRSPEQKLRLLKDSIASVRDVGYQKAYALR
jgi:hypothetical protein